MNSPFIQLLVLIFLLWCAALSVPASVAAERQQDTPFSRETLLELARGLAGQKYHPPKASLPQALKDLDYDAFRALRFRPDRQIWAEQRRGFTLDLLPPGFLYQAPVEINLVEDGQVVPIAFEPELFDSSQTGVDLSGLSGLFFSGFRVRYPLNRPDVMDEFLVFQGASYLRAVGRGQLYGLSARGLSVATGAAEGEEFPRFSRFWIERPSANATHLVVHALLESPSVVGAYRFDITPGVDTMMETEVSLFPRRELHTVGIAPQTSMFLFDAANRSRFDDFRSAVHDSGGLQMIAGNGERIFRPLANPVRLQVSSFQDTNPKGFGLVQRQRGFDAYQDAEARYEKRPSLWVEPLGDWGPGAVGLVEIPTRTEYNDNVVVLWRPKEPLQAGTAYAYRYRLHWSDYPPDDIPLARVAGTRIGAGSVAGARLFVVDFEGGGNGSPALELSSSAGAISRVNRLSLDSANRFRVSFEFDPGDSDVAELRLMLTLDEQPWAETWLYRWSR